MGPLSQSWKRAGLQRSVSTCLMARCLALLPPRQHRFAAPVTAVDSLPMVCGIYASMPVRVSICDSHYGLAPLARNSLLSLSLAGRRAATEVRRSAKHSRPMACAVPSSHLIASARTRILRCIHAEGSCSARCAQRLSTAASEKKPVLASHTVASAGTILQKCEIASQSPYICFFLEAAFKGGAGLKLAGKSVL